MNSHYIYIDNVPDDCLTLTININILIDDIDLKNVKTLNLSGKFNQSIERLDLKNVQTLYIEGEFNQPIENLDLKNLNTLCINSKFNKSIEKLDLKNLHTLHIGDNFTDCYFIKNLNLKNLHTLILGERIIGSINDLDLSRLKVLHIKNNFNDGLHLKNLDNLEELYFKDIILTKTKLFLGVHKIIDITSEKEFNIYKEIIKENIYDWYDNYDTRKNYDSEDEDFDLDNRKTYIPPPEEFSTYINEFKYDYIYKPFLQLIKLFKNLNKDIEKLEERIKELEKD
jgi:hypothetical protein